MAKDKKTKNSGAPSPETGLVGKHRSKQSVTLEVTKKALKKRKQVAQAAARVAAEREAAAARAAAARAAEPADVADQLRVGDEFSLAQVDPDSTPGFGGSSHDAPAALLAGARELSQLQERMYAAATADDKRSVLLVIQGVDTAGKGGIVRQVVGAVDPQGVQVTAFKTPTSAERAKGFLWRIRHRLPRPGYLGVFDRSHYEDVLAARVKGLATAQVWSRRYRSINTFERQCAERGITLVKVMLHISAQEQHDRLGERLQRRDKRWKYHPGDLDDHARWGQYQEAYSDALAKCCTDVAPWYVVPANKRWYARWAVQQILLDTLRRLDLAWPPATFDVAAESNRLASFGIDELGTPGQQLH